MCPTTTATEATSAASVPQSAPISTAATPFPTSQTEGHAGERLVAGAQHIGGPDIAGADTADVADAGEPGQQQPERDRAEQVGDDRGGNDAS